MKKIIINKVFGLFLLMLLLKCTSAPTISNLEKAEVPDFKEPKIQMHTFDNGLKLSFLPNIELPIFEMSAFIEVGTVDEPENKLGITSLMLAGLRTGGTKTQSAANVDKDLEQVAARLSSETRKEYSILKISSLIKDMDLSMNIFFDLLINPGFDSEQLEIQRRKFLEGIRRRNEKPISVANREFLQRLYGDESVWARHYTTHSIGSLKRKDIIDFFQKHVAPNNMRLMASGDLSFKEMVSKLKPFMDKWPKRKVIRPKLKKIQKEWQASVNVIHVPVNQSSIVVGHFGDKRFNPDKYALILANFMLGGTTFGSQLGVIRTTLGLAYSVYSDFGFGTDYGSFRVLVNTKTPSTKQVVQEIKKIIDDTVNNGALTEKDLQDAKNSILNKLIFQYEDPFEIVTTKVRFDYYGYPPNYLKIYQDEIKKVTLDQVKDVLKRYFFPDKLKVMIVGDTKEMGDLSELGKVKELPLDYD